MRTALPLHTPFSGKHTEGEGPTPSLLTACLEVGSGRGSLLAHPSLPFHRSQDLLQERRELGRGDKARMKN